MDSSIATPKFRPNYNRYFNLPAIISTFISTLTLLPLLINVIIEDADLNFFILFGPPIILFPANFPWVALLMILANFTFGPGGFMAMYAAPIFSGLSWGAIIYLLKYNRRWGVSLLVIYMTLSLLTTLLAIGYVLISIAG